MSWHRDQKVKTGCTGLQQKKLSCKTHRVWSGPLGCATCTQSSLLTERALTAPTSICFGPRQAYEAPPHSVLLCPNIIVTQVPLGTLSPPVSSFVRIGESHQFLSPILLASLLPFADAILGAFMLSFSWMVSLQSLSPMGICNPSDYPVFGLVSQQWWGQASQQGRSRP